MKKLKLLFIGLIFSTSLFANGNLNFVDTKTGESLGYMSKDSFKELVKTADFYNKILDSETNGDLSIYTETSIILVKGKDIKVPVYVVWKDSVSGKELKKLEGEIILNLEEISNVDKRTLYSKLAEIGFPVSLGFNGAFIIILMILI